MFRTIIAFSLCIVLISVLSTRLKIHPFLSLVSCAFIYGLLSGMDYEVIIRSIISGAGRIFMLLGIAIFSGIAIGEFLMKTKGIDRIVGDILRVLSEKNSRLVPGVSGYLLSVPVMCCITSFVILESIIRNLAVRIDESEKRFIYMLALGTIASYNLIYPSPVMVAITHTLDVPPFQTLKIAVPISILFLFLTYLYMRRAALEAVIRKVEEVEARISSVESWSPILFSLGLIFSGLLLEHPLIRFLGNINVALLIGVFVSLVVAKRYLSLDDLSDFLRSSVQRAGVIIFDLCGAGALGGVIAASTFSGDIFTLLGRYMPVIMIPFFLAALIQTAQGSRVVTALVTVELVKDMASIQTVFLICAGAFIFSYVSDPYFWLVKRVSDSSLKENVKYYTFPLAMCGILLALITLVIF